MDYVHHQLCRRCPLITLPLAPCFVDCSSDKQFHGDVLSFHDHGQVHNPGNDTSRSSFGLCSAVLCSLGYWIDGHERNHSEVRQSFSYCVHSHRSDGRKHDHHNLLWCD